MARERCPLRKDTRHPSRQHSAGAALPPPAALASQYSRQKRPGKHEQSHVWMEQQTTICKSTTQQESKKHHAHWPAIHHASAQSCLALLWLHPTGGGA
jgi:hypothetical protein